jgi:7-cyano-7-deazaguanine synthase
MSDRALVVLSGGQDSTTCLYWTIDRFGVDNVEAITFDYGQRHRIELECARQVAIGAGIRQTELPIDTFGVLGGNSLIDTDIDVAEGANGDLPNTFVPGRNLIFLTFAAAHAWQRGITNIVTGVAQTDYSGYPDCRQETIDSLSATLQLGMERKFIIHTPLMNMSKKETVLLAQELGAIEAMTQTHTCYEGQRPPCGKCPACVLRAKGFAEAGIEDPLIAK